MFTNYHELKSNLTQRRPIFPLTWMIHLHPFYSAARLMKLLALVSFVGKVFGVDSHFAMSFHTNHDCFLFWDLFPINLILVESFIMPALVSSSDYSDIYLWMSLWGWGNHLWCQHTSLSYISRNCCLLLGEVTYESHVKKVQLIKKKTLQLTGWCLTCFQVSRHGVVWSWYWTILNVARTPVAHYQKFNPWMQKATDNIISYRIICY